MARTEAAAQLTTQHRQLQLQLSAAVSRDYLTLWPLWTGDERSFAQLTAATVPLVQNGHRTSSGLASGYYRAYRFAEGVAGDATPTLAVFNTDQVVTSLYVTGQAQTRASLLAGMNPLQAREQALIRTMGAVTRHALNGGRETIVRSGQSDAQVTGWQRVTSGKPCAFCVSLSSRGPIYKSRETAAGGRWSDLDQAFKVHDHCNCHFVAIYESGAQAWTDQALGHRALYQRAQREAREAGELARGTSNDQLNALRRLMDAGV